MDWNKIFEIRNKYRFLPRKGYSVAGSRKKDNETIEVNRKEVCDILDQASSLAYSHDQFLNDSVFYESLLSILANKEPGAIKCDKCGSYYRSEWLKGKCPYCEADHTSYVTESECV